MPQELERDGNVDFSGGMDTSRRPYLLGRNQYSRACNVMIPRDDSSLKVRSGIHHQNIIGDINDVRIYNNCKNIQGEGWYNDGQENVLIRVVDGYVIELRKISGNTHRLKVLNYGDRNNPTRTKAWVIRVPAGCIVNDGQSLPLIVTRSFVRRSIPSQNEIKVGRMGIYVQNRLFYVDHTGKFIQVSDFRNPISILNSLVANIHGFVLPEDQYDITAIGEQKSSLDYVNGGVLSFSTRTSTYSVDVRGDIQNWEEQETGVGKIQETIPGIGAASSYSYETFNSNLWFRTVDLGLMNIKRSEFQFVNDDDYSSQSLEANYWFENDTKLLLDKCYTKQYRDRLFTTIAPAITDQGFTYWNGLISMNPDPIYNGSDKLPRRFEGIITGVRPWCMTSVSSNEGSELYIDSYDKDGKTRLYKVEDSSNFDVNHKGKRIEIESWLETRGYFHGDITMMKTPSRRAYFLFDIARTLNVRVSSRAEEEGPFLEFSNITHKVRSSGAFKKKDGNIRFDFDVFKAQSRKDVILSKEAEDKECDNPSSLGLRKFFTRQDRFDFKGPYSLGMWMREAEIADRETKSKDCQEGVEKSFKYTQKKDFTYSIALSED
jgi:hypothetical protein